MGSQGSCQVELVVPADRPMWEELGNQVLTGNQGEEVVGILLGVEPGNQGNQTQLWAVVADILLEVGPGNQGIPGSYKGVEPGSPLDMQGCVVEGRLQVEVVGVAQEVLLGAGLEHCGRKQPLCPMTVEPVTQTYWITKTQTYM